MAETDILNPVQGWSDDLGLNPNPTYGYTRKSSQNNVLARTRLGSWYTRETLNAGYAFELSWMNQPFAQVLRLKQFYEQYQAGYFTYVDWDGNGRHHVGRFTTPPNGIQVANGKYNISGMLFEEIPRARMLQYPLDWLGSSHYIYVIDDFGYPRVETSGNGWMQQVTGDVGSVASASYMLSAAPAAGDFAQLQYVGWGFQLTFPKLPGLGVCDIYVDGNLYIAAIDLSTGISPVTTLSSGVTVPAVAHGVVSNLQMSLDMHRVKVVARNVVGTSSTAAGIVFPAMQVMH